jgi:hypothetical protein
MLKWWICCDFLSDRRYKSFRHQLAADTSWCSTHQNWVKSHCFWDILCPIMRVSEEDCNAFYAWVMLSDSCALLACQSQSALVAVPFTAGSARITWRRADCLRGLSCIYLLCKLQIAHRKLTLFQVFRLHVSRVWIMNILLFVLAYSVVV